MLRIELTECLAACACCPLGSEDKVKRPTLWRYYGLSGLIVLALLTAFSARMIANKYQVEWLLKWGYKGIGFVCIGFCLLLGGLDSVVLHKEYPSSYNRFVMVGHPRDTVCASSRDRWAVLGLLVAP
jgi:hypothetical protein